MCNVSPDFLSFSFQTQVDPQGTAMRWCRSIPRRVYTVPGPNALWHIDGQQGLIQYVVIYLLLLLSPPCPPSSPPPPQWLLLLLLSVIVSSPFSCIEFGGGGGVGGRMLVPIRTRFNV